VEAIWRTIEQERVTGCQHRAPKKRPPKASMLGENATILNINKLDKDPTVGCLVKMDDDI